MCAVGLRNLQSESYVAFVKKGYAITLTNVLGKTFLALSAIFNFECNLIKSTRLLYSLIEAVVCKIQRKLE